ncbi:membrane protein insertase YidC [Mycoplasmopsis lipofaciens]|uniref:membrane protein insertase YidC n=1 Tax=Mycoplasmopsis lipofaciens TaxID=114884 RepID=UPI0004810756|nr:membrane protein insertase YidC [Mycoplasmopsis lipofaciens]
MKPNRSDNFDYFQKGSPQQKRKSLFKKIWYWFKLVIYILLFGLALTGCVQTFVIKNSSYTGNGTEFYTSKKRISPSVATFKKDKSETSKSDEFYNVEELPEANYHLNYETHANVIAELRKQAGADNYGKYNSYSSSIRLLNSDNSEVDGQPIFRGDNGKYLFKSYASNSYNSVFNNLETIKFLDPDFSFEKFYVKEKGKNEYSINKNIQAFQILGENKTHVYKTASIFSLNNTYNDSNRRYSRDVVELFYRQIFLPKYGNKFYDRVLKSVGFSSYEEWIQATIDYGKNGTGDARVESLTDEQMLAMSNYNKIIVNFIKKSALYESTSLIPRVDENGNILKNKNNEIQYTSFFSENSVLGDKDTTDSGRRIFTHSEAQKAIYSWAGAWKLGPFFGLMVWPIAWLTSSVREPLPAAGGWTTILAIVIAVILTRLIVLAFTWKATVNQSKQEDLKAKKIKIDAKYAEFKGNKQMKARQQQEIAELYRKNNINPLDAFLTIIISIPVFIAMWRVIQSVPDMKSTHWLGMDFAATSWRRLFFEAEWQYLFILITAAITQVFSQITPRLLNRKKFKERTTLEEAAAIKKNNKTQNIILVVFLVLTLAFSCGVQVYWIFSSVWNIIQTIAIHYFKKTKYYREKYKIKA